MVAFYIYNGIVIFEFIKQMPGEEPGKPWLHLENGSKCKWKLTNKDRNNSVLHTETLFWWITLLTLNKLKSFHHKQCTLCVCVWEQHHCARMWMNVQHHCECVYVGERAVPLSVCVCVWYLHWCVCGSEVQTVSHIQRGSKFFSNPLLIHIRLVVHALTVNLFQIPTFACLVF